MTANPDAPPRAGRSYSPGFALVLLVIGSLGIAAAWVLVAYAHGRQSSWMAVIAALDAAILLRLARAPSSWWRAACGVFATVAVIVLANWGIAATQIGKAMGLLPWESFWRLGPTHGWTLITLANPQPQLAWLLAALVVAVVSAR